MDADKPIVTTSVIGPVNDAVEKNREILVPNPEVIVNEHLWFTATTIAFNAFLITRNFSGGWWWAAIVVSLGVSLFACWLILIRAAAHARQLPRITVCHREDWAGLRFREKWRQWLDEYKAQWFAALRYSPFAVCELSGSSFYLLLVLLSFVGVILC